MTHQNDPPDDMPTQTVLKPLVLKALSSLGGKAHRQAFLAKAKALGGFTQAQLEKPTHSLGRRRQYRSELDYRLSWTLHHCHSDGDVRKLGGGFWALEK